jgi:hypothetical protein
MSVQEDALRIPVLVTSFSIGLGTAALADTSVAGNWHANLDSGVTIDMQVAPNGAWSSETFEQNKVVRRMRGTYTQAKAGDGVGTLVFTPKQYAAKSGRVTTETDSYELGKNGRQLKLTSEGDTMVFEKRGQHPSAAPQMNRRGASDG